MRLLDRMIEHPLLYALAASAVLNVVLFGLWRINRAEAMSADVQIAAAADANTGNMATINSLRAAVDACVGQEKHLADLAAQAAEDLIRAEAERAEAARLSKQSRTRIYDTDPTCRTWAAAAECRAVSDGL